MTLTHVTYTIQLHCYLHHTDISFSCCAGLDEDRSQLELSPEVVDRAMELLGNGSDCSHVMRKINESMTSYADACNRRKTLTPNDMVIIKKRFDRGKESKARASKRQ
jgi:hypothetical protein